MDAERQLPIGEVPQGADLLPAYVNPSALPDGLRTPGPRQPLDAHYLELERALTDVEQCSRGVSLSGVREHVHTSFGKAAEATSWAFRAIALLNVQCAKAHHTSENKETIKRAKRLLRDVAVWHFFGLGGGLYDVEHADEFMPTGRLYDKDLASQLGNTRQKILAHVLEELITSDVFRNFVRQVSARIGEDEERDELRDRLLWAVDVLGKADVSDVQASTVPPAVASGSVIGRSGPILPHKEEESCLKQSSQVHPSEEETKDGRCARQREIARQMAQYAASQLHPAPSTEVEARLASMLAVHGDKDKSIPAQARKNVARQLPEMLARQEALITAFQALRVLCATGSGAE